MSKNRGDSFGIRRGLYYYPAHLFFVWPRPKGRWYPHHPVAWDDLCALPFPRLDRLLVAYSGHDPDAAATEIRRLVETYPAQRMSALRAETILIARRAGDASDLSRLDDLVARLPEGDKGFLALARALREKVAEITRLQRRLDTQDRPFLREPTAALLCKEIENFRHRIGGFPEPLASEFGKAADQWLKRAEAQRDGARAVLEREPAPAVFRAGDPVDRGKEAFVPRERVLGRLDRQLTLAAGCPGLVLYGRRRMGKSTLLRNLDGFLPGSVLVANISMMQAKAFASLSNLLELIAGAVREAAGPLNLLDLRSPDLPGFEAFLGACDSALREADKRLLIALDEYEYIDLKIGEGVFSVDLLTLIRESIQSHRQLIWLFAGSHHIAELRNAEWTSYLVSARTLEVPPFEPAETTFLLTEPLKSSSLW